MVVFPVVEEEEEEEEAANMQKQEDLSGSFLIDLGRLSDTIKVDSDTAKYLESERDE
jgi:hypothetical protein